MLQLVAFIVFIISVSGVTLILCRKIPILIELPQNGYNGFKKPEFFLELEKKVKELYFHFFKKQMLLHKLLSWIKVWTLKLETKVDYLLSSVRKKAQELDKQIKKR